MQALSGSIFVPGDKSITHRSILFSAVANGRSRVRTAVMGRDNLATLRIMGQLGVSFHGALTSSMLRLAEEEGIEGFTLSTDDLCELFIEGKGFRGLRSPASELDCGNSGTTSRLLCGFLSGTPFSSTLIGDHSLSKRPFKRVTEPLLQMGATFSGEFLPLTITGGALRGIEYFSPKASAQVKSAILLAGLQAEGVTIVEEPWKSRDHTERMLTAMGADLLSESVDKGNRVTLRPNGDSLQPLDILVPGDFSAAAFFLVAASIIPDSDIRIQNVCQNPTRNGLEQILRRMGADIAASEFSVVGGEDVAEVRVRSQSLRGVEVGAEDVVLAIDEIPILAVAAAFAEGDTRIVGAEELRVKESDRLTMTCEVLQSFGVRVQELADGMVVSGSKDVLKPSAGGEAWRTSGDHRIAMAGAVLEYAVTGALKLSDVRAVETSFPNFEQCFQALISR